MYRIKTLLLLMIAGIFSLLIAYQIVTLQTKGQLYDHVESIPWRKSAVVLGTSKYGKYGLNPYFKKRMDAAAKLYFNGKVDELIVSGDNHIKSYNETEDMRNYLIQLGVPAAAIICDYAGFRTLDSVIRAKKTFGCNEITIVSQEFHNQRALYIANYYGLNAISFNAEDVASTTNVTHFREILAKLLVVFDLHLFKRQPKFL